MALLALALLATAAMRLGVFSFPGAGGSEAGARVVRVVDGDTIRVTFGGRGDAVRDLSLAPPPTPDPLFPSAQLRASLTKKRGKKKSFEGTPLGLPGKRAAALLHFPRGAGEGRPLAQTPPTPTNNLYPPQPP